MAPKIDYKSIPDMHPGESIRVADYVTFTAPGYSSSDILALNFRDDTGGGGYFTLNGTTIPAGRTIDFFRDSSSITGQYDYSLSQYGNLRFHAGTTNSTDKLVINAALEGYGNVGTEYGTVNTTVNTPVISVQSATSGYMTEGRAITYTIELSEASNTDVRVYYNLSGRQPNPTNGSDLSTSSSYFLIRAGQTQASMTVTSNDDRDYEGTEFYRLELTSNTGNATISTVDGKNYFTGTLYDNDSPPEPDPEYGTLNIVAHQTTLDEGDTGETVFRFTVNRSDGSDGNVSVQYQVLLGDTAQTDYVSSPSTGYLQFLERVTSKTIEVKVRGDVEVEPNEDFTVRILNPSGGVTLGSVTQVTNTIRNDDADEGLVGPPYVVELPFVSGEVGGVWQVPGSGSTHKNDLHQSYDFGRPLNSAVLAVADGIIIEVIDWVPDGPSIRTNFELDSMGPSGIGNMVTLEHTASNGDKFYSSYFHLKGPDENGTNVPLKKGFVEAGTVLGYVGRTGYAYASDPNFDPDHIHIQFSSEKVAFSGKYWVADADDNTVDEDFLIFRHSTSENGAILEKNSNVESTNSPVYQAGGGGGGQFTNDSDTVSVSGEETFLALNGNDNINGDDVGNRILGQSGNDKLFGHGGDDWLYGGSGNDKVYSGQGADNVFLGDGDDYVKVGGGLEEFHGGSGKDYISYYDSAGGVNVNLATNAVSGSWAANDTISGFESVSGSKTGGDTIYGTSGSNTIQTYGGNDKVYAGKGADKVNLGDGDDYVKVGGGLEEFHGGSGKDYISYYDSAGGVNVNLATNAVSGSWAANDTISGFESVSGSKTGGDTIYGTSGSNTIQTYGGNDKVYAGKGADKVNLGDGDDYVKVGGGLEEFHGGSGKDYISYYDSAGGVNVNLATNAVSGSWAANDTISGFESVSGSKTGGDTIYGTSGSNTIKTYGGNDEVYAGMGSDKVELGSGNDYVKVGGGIESFDGGSGTDYISYYDSAGGITIDLEADSVSGSWADNDTISDFEGASGSKTGADKMYGTSGSNTLKSYGGDDKLYGRGGDDKLYGGDGEDRFDGGAGTDLLYGGAGADVFHFDFGEDHDIIKDFENNIDTIQLDDFTFAEGQDAFDFATQVASDVVFDFGGGDMLTVENTTIGLLYNDLEII